jgi:hypothetical protein
MTALSVTSASAQLDAGGTIWRLRSLFAMGHGSSRIARAMNIRPETIRKLVRGDTATVSPAFRDLACALWNAWWDKRPPERTRSQRSAASAARRRAERHGWPAAAALDEDELDQPGYKPYSRYRPATGTGTAPDFRPASYRGNATIRAGDIRQVSHCQTAGPDADLRLADRASTVNRPSQPDDGHRAETSKPRPYVIEIQHVPAARTDRTDAIDTASRGTAKAADAQPG